MALQEEDEGDERLHEKGERERKRGVKEIGGGGGGALHMQRDVRLCGGGEGEVGEAWNGKSVTGRDRGCWGSGKGKGRGGGRRKSRDTDP